MLLFDRQRMHQIHGWNQHVPQSLITNPCRLAPASQRASNSLIHVFLKQIPHRPSHPLWKMATSKIFQQCQTRCSLQNCLSRSRILDLARPLNIHLVVEGLWWLWMNLTHKVIHFIQTSVDRNIKTYKNLEQEQVHTFSSENRGVRWWRHHIGSRPFGPGHGKGIQCGRSQCRLYAPWWNSLWARDSGGFIPSHLEITIKSPINTLERNNIHRVLTWYYL